MDEIFDLIVIGSGPAGVSAALTARHRGKSALMVTTAPEDSMLWRAEHIDNYPGFPAATGPELVTALVRHAEASGVKLMRGRALAVADLGGVFGVSVGADFVQGRAVVLACGLTRAKPFPGEAEYLGRGVSYCATCDGMLYRGRRVAVVGLSAEAPEEAGYLRSIGCEVEYFDAGRAKRYEITGAERVTALRADGEEFPVEGVFIFRSGPRAGQPAARARGRGRAYSHARRHGDEYPRRLRGGRRRGRAVSGGQGRGRGLRRRPRGLQIY